AWRLPARRRSGPLAAALLRGARDPEEYALAVHRRVSAASAARSRVRRHAGEPRHDGLLSVQTVLRLVEHDGAWAVDHGVGDLLPAVGRQAVHHQPRGTGGREEALVHLIVLERAAACRGLALLAHAGPDVGVEDVGAPDRRLDVVRDRDACARLGRDGRVGLVPARAGEDEVEPETGGRIHPGVRHVVAVAHEHYAEPGDAAAVLQPP